MWKPLRAWHHREHLKALDHELLTATYNTPPPPRGLLVPGWYTATVFDCELRTSKSSGRKYWSITFYQILNESPDRRLWMNQVVHMPTSVERALGLDVSVIDSHIPEDILEAIARDLRGLRCDVHVRTTEWFDRKMSEIDDMRVHNHFGRNSQ